jgi:TPR repeat protein
MNFTGQGTARDHAEALNWYRRAAEQGDVNASTISARCTIKASGWRRVVPKR